jgi:predicted unusual protein kinase regulating ubiquinone biosynthesis (AarF/ABC1/UbiB family)
MRRAVEETWETLAPHNETPSLAVLLARLGDLTRSNSFLWAEAGLRVQERRSRKTQRGQVLSRTLVLGTLAADIFAGYTTLRERARWWPDFIRARDWNLQHQRGANRILDTASSLGGALIKACQFASTRPDLLPPVYIRTLSRLQDRMPPHVWPEIEAAIARELGRSPYEVFARIDQEPIAAASIAQVHRAQLRDGREVAVKVQYPEIAGLVGADLTVLERVAGAIARVTPTVQLQPIVDYLKGTLPMELDFKHEASSMIELRSALQHRSDVLIPEVFTELNTERMIIMEYVEGIKITDRDALIKAGISPSEVAKLLNDLYAEQMLRLKYLHGDPHPGNLLVQPGPRIVLLDHGLSVPLKDSLVQALSKLVQGIVAGNIDAINAALAEAGLQFNKKVDVGTLLQLVGVLLGEERTTNFLEVGTNLSTSIGSIPLDLLLVGRALGLLDGITRQLDPELEAMELVANYV